MAGVLDILVEQTRKPQGHGYEVASVDRDNPYFVRGEQLAGHEFHYSHIVSGKDLNRTVLEVSRGTGCGNGRDGIVKGRVWASYLHLHALGSPSWADGLLNTAMHFAAERAAARAAWA
jgi:cobyrinic acid a,c-diamide synthase